MDAAELGLRAMGAFYVFAGYVATRAALTSHLIDRALVAISVAKPAPAETAQSLWLLAAANLILIGGAALVLLLDAAAWISSPRRSGKRRICSSWRRSTSMRAIRRTRTAAANRRTPSSSMPRLRLSCCGPRPPAG